MRFLALFFLYSFLTACAAAPSLPADQAQQRVAGVWHTHQHTVWVLDWPATPVGGAVTVETWRAGDQYRYEILEAVAPALIGEMLVVDGQTAWQTNRFDDEPSLALESPSLPPVSDAFLLVERLVALPPQSATQETVQTVHGAAQKISVRYANGHHLTLWQDEISALPVKIVVSTGQSQLTLTARAFEPLVDPPKSLFDRP